MDVYAHVNYFELKYPQLNFSTDRMFELAAEMGYDGIELRAPMEGVPYAMEECAQLAKKYEMKGVTFGGNYNAATDDPAVRAAETKRFIDCVRTAAKIGTRFLNFQTGALRKSGVKDNVNSGSAIATDRHFEQVADMLRTVGKLALDEGITLCMETHPGYIHDRARATRRLIDLIGLESVKANLDWVNVWALGEETEEETLSILGKDIRYIHLKNGYVECGKWVATSLADGHVNTFNYLRTLNNMGYDGLIVPEYPRQGDRRYFARRDLDYIRDVLAALEWD